MPEQTAPVTATILEKVMSKYTAEQVERAAIGCENMMHGHAAPAMLREYADLLRERESARAGVTDEMVALACGAYLNAPPGHMPDEMRAALEAVAPMLANAWVPDNCVLIAVERPEGYEDVHPDLVAEDFAGDAPERGWAYQVIAAVPKPEISERHHWLCCGALNHDHSDKPRVMPDCFDPERHVWAVSPKPKTEE